MPGFLETQRAGNPTVPVSSALGLSVNTALTAARTPDCPQTGPVEHTGGYIKVSRMSPSTIENHSTFKNGEGRSW